MTTIALQNHLAQVHFRNQMFEKMEKIKMAILQPTECPIYSCGFIGSNKLHAMLHFACYHKAINKILELYAKKNALESTADFLVLRDSGFFNCPMPTVELHPACPYCQRKVDEKQLHFHVVLYHLKEPYEKEIKTGQLAFGFPKEKCPGFDCTTGSRNTTSISMLKHYSNQHVRAREMEKRVTSAMCNTSDAIRCPFLTNRMDPCPFDFHIMGQEDLEGAYKHISSHVPHMLDDVVQKVIQLASPLQPSPSLPVDCPLPYCSSKLVTLGLHIKVNHRLELLGYILQEIGGRHDKLLLQLHLHADDPLRRFITKYQHGPTPSSTPLSSPDKRSGQVSQIQVVDQQGQEVQIHIQEEQVEIEKKDQAGLQSDDKMKEEIQDQEGKEQDGSRTKPADVAICNEALLLPGEMHILKRHFVTPGEAKEQEKKIKDELPTFEQKGKSLTDLFKLPEKSVKDVKEEESSAEPDAKKVNVGLKDDEEALLDIFDEYTLDEATFSEEIDIKDFVIEDITSDHQEGMDWESFGVILDREDSNSDSIELVDGRAGSTTNADKEIENNSEDFDGQSEQRLDFMIERRAVGFACIKCGYTSNKISNVKEHAQTHIEGLEYPCNSCGKVFRTSGVLRSHRRYHCHRNQNSASDIEIIYNRNPSKDSETVNPRSTGEVVNGAEIEKSHKESQQDKSTEMMCLVERPQVFQECSSILSGSVESAEEDQRSDAGLVRESPNEVFSKNGSKPTTSEDKTRPAEEIVITDSEEEPVEDDAAITISDSEPEVDQEGNQGADQEGLQGDLSKMDMEEIQVTSNHVESLSMSPPSIIAEGKQPQKGSKAFAEDHQFKEEVVEVGRSDSRKRKLPSDDPLSRLRHRYYYFCLNCEDEQPGSKFPITFDIASHIMEKGHVDFQPISNLIPDRGHVLIENITYSPDLNKKVCIHSFVFTAHPHQLFPFS